jgi:hypothetical protein
MFNSIVIVQAAVTTEQAIARILGGGGQARPQSGRLSRTCIERWPGAAALAAHEQTESFCRLGETRPRVSIAKAKSFTSVDTNDRKVTRRCTL